MINVNVKYGDTTTTIDFPCSSNALEAKLMELHLDDMTKVDLFIEKVNDYDEFSFLEDNFVNLDELNFLANRMDTLEAKEIKKFNAVIKEFNIRNMPELINLTGNMNRYTLIQDLSNPEAIGKEHYLTRNMAISEDEMKSMDFAEIGKELINSGTGRFTDYGMLFANSDIPEDRWYEGVPTPENLNGDKIAEVEIDTGNKKIYMWFPETENTIKRMLNRIGENTDLMGSRLEITGVEFDNDKIKELIGNILDDEGILEFNKAVNAINMMVRESDLCKLSAVIEYAGVCDSSNIVNLCDYFDKFEYIPDAKSYEDIAKYIIDEADEYHIDVELRDYFLDEQFGEDIMRDRGGQFVDDGAILMKDGYTLKNIIDTPDEEQGMTMM